MALQGGLTLAEIARLVQGELHGPADLVVNSVRGLDHPEPGCLAFVESSRAVREAEASPAAALLAPPGTRTQLPAIWVENPRLGFARALAAFHPEPPLQPGVSPSASVSPAARIAPSARVGPYCRIAAGAVLEDRVEVRARAVVGPGACIGADTRILPGVVVGAGCSVGPRCLLDANALLGPACRLGSDVYIGARTVLNSCRIGDGCKLDNLVHVERDVVLGNHCILVCQASVGAGSRLGNLVVLAGQGRVGAGVTVADRVQIAGRSLVLESIDTPGGAYAGDPARPLKEELRLRMLVARAWELYRRGMRALEASAPEAPGESSR
ncbi:MAG: hypothetical protein HY319_31670 [Armatimonadetes bacterium]|nr:hypothetical protein [Armatimonadota bacterium]